MPAFSEESIKSTSGNQLISGARRLSISELYASGIGAYIRVVKTQGPDGSKAEKNRL